MLAATPVVDSEGEEIGRSREGRPIRAYRFGRGPRRVSLLAGCHADEPVGPRLLRLLAGYLGAEPDASKLLSGYEWWVLPHVNPDGARRNWAWQHQRASAYDLSEYLTGVTRELPGDDIEFGFPRGEGDREARPENRAAWEWWRRAAGPFSLHASLHGMGFGAGPWFLIEPAWRRRCDALISRCASATAALGYTLHDVERRGEKGFFRIAPGFCTRPDSRHMRRYFLARADEATADRFRPSSMEAIRALGGDPLTLVSEMPLFLTLGVGVEIGPPDPAALAWKERLEGWRERLRAAWRQGIGELPLRSEAGSEGTAESGESTEPRLTEMEAVRAEAAAAGLRPMPVEDQMRLQWTMIVAGLELL